MNTKILILCTGNSARSQMAEAFLKSFSSDLEVYFAGVNPSETVNPYAVTVMKEIDIDISNAKTKNVANFVNEAFDFVITVCDDAKNNCPYFAGNVKKRLHFSIPDPIESVGNEKQTLKIFRTTRDKINSIFLDFIKFEKLA